MFDPLSSQDHEHLADGDTYHVGTVIFNDDPNRQQRIKATVPGFLTDTSADNLPWIGPVAQSPFGNTVGFGTVRVPVIGSLVIIKFQGGDKNHGVYEGYACTMAMGQAMPVELSTNYPNRYGYWDPKGNIAFTDLTTGEMQIRHYTGTKIDIDTNGNVIGTFVKDVTATIAGNGSITVDQNLNLTVNGDITSKASMWTHTGLFQATEVQNAIGIVLGTHEHETYGTFSPTSSPIVP